MNQPSPDSFAVGPEFYPKPVSLQVPPIIWDQLPVIQDRLRSSGGGEASRGELVAALIHLAGELSGEQINHLLVDYRVRTQELKQALGRPISSPGTHE